MHWKLLGYALDVTSSCKGCCACKGRERFLFPLFFIPPLLPRPSNRRSSKHDAIHDHRTRYGETWMLEKYDWNFGNNSVSRDKVFISKSSLCFIESATKNSIRWSNDLVPSPLFFSRVSFETVFQKRTNFSLICLSTRILHSLLRHI